MRDLLRGAAGAAVGVERSNHRGRARLTGPVGMGTYVRTMAKSKSPGAAAYLCGECQAWGTVVEQAAPRSRVQAGPVSAPARPIGDIPIEDSQARSSGVPELD